MYPEDFEVHIVGIDGYKPITTEAHFRAAGWQELFKSMPEEQKKEPAHFNRPFFEIVLDQNDENTSTRSSD
jgi:hypothetical protein